MHTNVITTIFTLVNWVYGAWERQYLAHLSRNVKWAIIIADRLSVRQAVRLLTFHIFDVFSRTAGWILMKLGRDEVLMVPYKCCCFSARSAQGLQRQTKWIAMIWKHVGRSVVIFGSIPKSNFWRVFVVFLDLPYKRIFSRVSNFAILWSKVVFLFSRVQFFANLKIHKMFIPKIWLFKGV